MPTVSNPVDSIERFAEVCAMLDDPFADEERILRPAGVDPGAWDEVEARWLARMSASAAEASSLSAQFGKAYQAERARLAAGANNEAVPPTEPTGGFLSTE